MGEFVPSRQAVFTQGTRRGWGRGLLSPRVPEMRRKGPTSQAILRDICSVILGPCKLVAMLKGKRSFHALYGDRCMNKGHEES